MRFSPILPTVHQHFTAIVFTDFRRNQRVFHLSRLRTQMSEAADPFGGRCGNRGPGADSAGETEGHGSTPWLHATGSMPWPPAGLCPKDNSAGGLMFEQQLLRMVATDAAADAAACAAAAAPASALAAAAAAAADAPDPPARANSCAISSPRPTDRRKPPIPSAGTVACHDG